MLMTFISGAYIPVSGAHFVINRAWALHHKLGQPELLTDPQLRHPDDSVEGQLWERKQGHEGTKSQVPPHASTTRLEITSSPPRRVGRNCNTFDHWGSGATGYLPRAHSGQGVRRRQALSRWFVPPVGGGERGICKP